jgi:hypothetical protein
MRLLSAAREHRLIPCEFKVVLGPAKVQPNGVYGRAVEPLEEGLGLVDVRTGEEVDLLDMTSDKKIEMSAWERRAFAIQVAVNALKKDYDVKIESFCSVLGIDPQIWLQDDEGKMCWCIVREWVGADPDAPTAADFADFIEDNEHLKPYDGYFVGVSMASMALVVYDAEGNLIPLSQRFTPACPLYRGDPLTTKKFEFECIYSAED